MLQGRLFAGRLFAGRLFKAPAAIRTGDAGFDAPYQAYVKRINAQSVVHGQRTRDERQINDVAISQSERYDSAVGRVAPRVGANPVLQTVAPMLNDAGQGILISTLPSTRSAAVQHARHDPLDDEAAMLALFMLMADD